MSESAPVQKTNGLAIASLVLSLVGFGFIAAILGHVALGQIKRQNEAGRGLALAGVIIGWVATAAALFWFIAFAGASLPSKKGCPRGLHSGSGNARI